MRRLGARSTGYFHRYIAPKRRAATIAAEMKLHLQKGEQLHMGVLQFGLRFVAFATVKMFLYGNHVGVGVEYDCPPP